MKKSLGQRFYELSVKFLDLDAPGLFASWENLSKEDHDTLERAAKKFLQQVTTNDLAELGADIRFTPKNSNRKKRTMKIK